MNRLLMYTQAHLQTPSLDRTDAVLANQALSGDQEAFEFLVQRYQAPLFNFIYRFLGDYDLACDVLQQAFPRFYTSLPKLATEEPFKLWLFQVAHHCCADELKRKQRQTLHFSRVYQLAFELTMWFRLVICPVPQTEVYSSEHKLVLEVEKSVGELASLNDCADSGSFPEDVGARHDLRVLLQDAIQTLPPKFRSVLILCYSSQMSFFEIGQVLSLPEAMTKTYFHRAKALQETRSGSLDSYNAIEPVLSLEVSKFIEQFVREVLFIAAGKT
jgi:RNA polymerase sigma factor (sigma-70 family)